jgi:hypothetical protein
MADATVVGQELESLGFVDQGTSRMGGHQWTFTRNRFLTFTAHHFGGGEIVLTWTFELGEFALERDMQIGAGETSIQELYPRYDVKLPADANAVRGEVERVLGLLRFDLGAPDL